MQKDQQEHKHGHGGVNTMVLFWKQLGIRLKVSGGAEKEEKTVTQMDLQVTTIG